MTATSLVDTNLLVYRHDPQDPRKRSIATEILRRGTQQRTLAIAYQGIVEFVAATTRPRKWLDGRPLLSPAEALAEAEKLLLEFPVLYPSRDHLVAAMRATTFYGLSWFDARMWAYAEVGGITELLSEDFQHGRHYGTVRAVNPFLQSGSGVHELPPLYAAAPAKAKHPTRRSAR